MPSLRTDYLVYAAIAWLAAVRAVRVWRAAAACNQRGPLEAALPRGRRRLTPAWPEATLCAAACLAAAGWWLAAPLFLTGATLGAVRVLAVAAVAAAFVDLVLAWARSPRAVLLAPGQPPAASAQSPTFAAPASAGKNASPTAPTTPSPATAIVTLLVALTVLGFALYLRSVPGGRGAALRVGYPVRGTWIVRAGGRTALTNAHHGHPSAQDCAIDAEHAGGDTEGQTVTAPVAGAVLRAIDRHGVGEPEPEGNVVVIRTDSGVDVWLAHLEDNSVVVATGDRVAAGQPVGRCGATGNAARPHLHVHAERSDRAVPLLFGPEARFLLRGDTFRN